MINGPVYASWSPERNSLFGTAISPCALRYRHVEPMRLLQNWPVQGLKSLRENYAARGEVPQGRKKIRAVQMSGQVGRVALILLVTMRVKLVLRNQVVFPPP